MVTGEGEHLRRFFILNHSIVRKNGQFFISSHLTPRVTYIDFYTTEAKTAKRQPISEEVSKNLFRVSRYSSFGKQISNQ